MKYEYFNAKSLYRNSSQINDLISVTYIGPWRMNMHGTILHSLVGLHGVVTVIYRYSFCHLDQIQKHFLFIIWQNNWMIKLQFWFIGTVICKQLPGCEPVGAPLCDRNLRPPKETTSWFGWRGSRCVSTIFVPRMLRPQTGRTCSPEPHFLRGFPPWSWQIKIVVNNLSLKLISCNYFLINL
jgi:hypothetical protein